jgi:long-chain acyl-CoA synthetase
MTATAERPVAGGPAGPARATLPAILLDRARTTPTGIALRKKELGRWKEYDWQTYALRAARIAGGLRTLGVEPGDRVAIHAENRPGWVMADLAIQGIGAICVGIYPTSPESEVAYLMNHSGSTVLIAEDEEQLDKALAVRDELITLRKIVVMDTRGVDMSDDLLLSFEELESLGFAASLETFAAEVSSIDPSKTAVIVYTSGTTGPPKGAMISHDNLIAATESAAAQFAVSPGDEVLSYLPLCHIAERLVSVINAVGVGYTVNFGEGGESFVTDLQEVQPTFFLGVPRVWEKFMAGVEIRMSDASRIKQAVYRSQMKRGAKIAQSRMKGGLGAGGKISYLIGWLLLYRSVRKKLGLLRVREALSGAAPISPQVLEYFWALGVPVREGYGQTENTAQATITPIDDVRIGTVGRAVPGSEVMIGPGGEILTRGPGTFVGYYKDPTATAETVDADGWLHTGDVGVLDADGFLTITDRMKDIIITAGGKNVSPSEIENKLKVSPFIREAIVVGDARKYLTALIGIEADTVGNWAARRNLMFTTYADLASKPEVVELITTAVDEANIELAQVETIKAFRLLPKELDQEDGEVTATQKVKRKAIAQEFDSLIESMYQGGTAS